MFIEKLSLTSDVTRINSELTELLSVAPWTAKNQIGLTCRPNSDNCWYDSIGNLYDRANSNYSAKEADFTQWNVDTSYYVRQQLELLKSTQNIQLGRARFMKIASHRGLSVHRDDEIRYHLVLQTNPMAYVAHRVVETNGICDLPTTAICYHMPADGHWYKMDTLQTHWVYNGGLQDRIHLVVCKQ